MNAQQTRPPLAWFGRAAAELRAWRVHTDHRLSELEQRQRSIETNQIALGTQMDAIQAQLTKQQRILERTDRYVTGAVRERKRRRLQDEERHRALGQLFSWLITLLSVLLCASLGVLLLSVDVRIIGGIVAGVTLLCAILIRHHIVNTRPLPPDEDEP